MTDIGKDLQDAYEHGRQDALAELMEYTYGMLTAEKFGLQHKIKSMMADRKTENSSEKPNNSTISKMEQVDKDINVRSKDEPQTDCAEALTLLWINNMVTDEEFYRIDARLKCVSCKWWNDTIVGGSECASKECTYQPKDEPQTVLEALLERQTDEDRRKMEESIRKAIKDEQSGKE